MERHELDVVLAENRRELHGRVSARTDSRDALTIGLGFRRADGANGRRPAFGAKPRRIALAPRGFRSRERALLGDAHHLLGLDDVALQVRDGGFALERLLRDRLEDLPALAEHFMKRFAREQERAADARHRCRRHARAVPVFVAGQHP